MITDVVFGVVFIGFVLYHAYETAQWRKERSQLLDRIQAKDLPEYKALQYEKPTQPETKKEDPMRDLQEV